ncbi:zinc ABC transporter substrate-binding protein [bacterium]|nr:zinc ABC transporter substrate-binding protein [bacterium]
MSSRWSRWVVGVSAALVLAVAAEAAPLRVVATTGMVGDLATQIAGDHADVEYLMGPGVDPHLYKATASDVRKLQRADVILYNGLFLEGKMQSILERMAKGGRHVAAITARLDHNRLLDPGDGSGHPDPHVWFDILLWAQCVPVVVETLSKAAPDSAAYFQQQGERVTAELLALHAWAQELSAHLPAAKRILVTSHDAYGYFGEAYGFQVVGLQGISTVSEAALADMASLVDFIKSRGVKAIFVESSVPHATIERIATDAKVAIGGELFSDAMGTPGQMENGYDLGTYDGMVRHNLTTIVEALR